MEFKISKPKQNFSFDKPFDIPENWLMRVAKLQLFNTGYNITEGKEKLPIIYLVLMHRSLQFLKTS